MLHILTILLVILKLTGALQLDWLWVLLPSLIRVIYGVILLVLVTRVVRKEHGHYIHFSAA